MRREIGKPRVVRPGLFHFRLRQQVARRAAVDQRDQWAVERISRARQIAKTIDRSSEAKCLVGEAQVCARNFCDPGRQIGADLIQGHAPSPRRRIFFDGEASALIYIETRTAPIATISPMEPAGVNAEI